MRIVLKIISIILVTLIAFLIRQYRFMLECAKEVTQKLKSDNYTIYTGKSYEESDLYDDRVFEETRCHYYDKFYKSENVSPGMLKGMFKWKYAKKITKKDTKDVFTDIGTNTGQFAKECAKSFEMSSEYIKINKKSANDLIK